MAINKGRMLFLTTIKYLFLVLKNLRELRSILHLFKNG